jgi:hypothetical protein
MSNEMQKQSNPIQVVKGDLQMQTIDDLWRVAGMFYQSGLCADNLDTQAKVVVVLQGGAELGFKPWQSLQVLHVVNGRLGMEGSAMLAKIRKSQVCEYVTMYFEGTPYEDAYRAIVKSKRKADSLEYVTEFSVDDAKRARLWEAKDNWKKYPKDMLTWRAVSRHGRRYYSDEIWAMYTPDELEEIEAVPVSFGEAEAQAIKQIEGETGSEPMDTDFEGDAKAKAKAKKEKEKLAAAEKGKGKRDKTEAPAEAEPEKTWTCNACFEKDDPKVPYTFAKPGTFGKKGKEHDGCPKCYSPNIENSAAFDAAFDK